MSDTNSRINPETLRQAIVMLESISGDLGEPEFSKWLLNTLRDKQAMLQALRDQRRDPSLQRKFGTKDLSESQSWLEAIRRRPVGGGE